MKAISAQLNTPNPDPAEIRDRAAEIQNHAGAQMTDKFPEGSLDHPTEATPAIWQDWDRFAALANQLNLQAKGLAMAAANPVTGNAPAPQGNRMLMDYAVMGPDEVFKLIGSTCGSCHKSFRIKK